MSWQSISPRLLNKLGLLAFGAGAVWMGFEAGARRGETPTAAVATAPASPTAARTEVGPPATNDDAAVATAVRVVHAADRGIAQPIPAFASSPNRGLRTSSVSGNVEPTPAPDAGAALRTAEVRHRQAVALLSRGAWFSARAELNESLRLVAAAAETTDGSSPSAALAEAMLILTEAEDFVPRSSRLDPQPEVARIVAGHRSQVIGAGEAIATPAEAREAYLDAACRRLSVALGSQPIGSAVAHQLGKIYAALATTSAKDVVDPRGKARVFYRAALEADPRNVFAANDLAVLLGEEGRWEEARGLLQVALQMSPQPAVWNNLAAVHDRLGETDWARQARLEARSLESAAPTSAGRIYPTHNVAWLSPQQFAATVQPTVDPLRAAPAAGVEPSSPPGAFGRPNGAPVRGSHADAHSMLGAWWSRLRAPASTAAPIETAARPSHQAWVH